MEIKNKVMMQVLVLNNDTIEKIQVIGKRIGDNSVASVKAMMLENLKLKLQSGVAHFVYMKKDGSLREAWGTTNPALARAKTNGNGLNRELFKTLAYFDIEKSAWRSFRWETLIQVF